MPERNYSNGELRTMQEEAARRVAEMRRIANEHLRRSAPVPQEPPRPEPQIQQIKPAPKPVHRALPVEFPSAAEAPFSSGGLEGIIRNLGLESDRMILIGLLILLINEGADTVLILAVFYLLL